ncbi:MAG TPA: phosphonoacetaldehyde reductase [Acidimicrobiia bacterium]|nr:phosphonoacetaldehyde reductase [Acidimicrobiia bacterium]
MRHLCIPGSISTVVDLIARLDPRSVLVVTGGRSYEASGAAAVIERAVDGRRVSIVRDVPADPASDDVRHAVGVFRSDPPDLVIAVGGGSVIDLAKAVRTIGPTDADPTPFLVGERTIEPGGPPLLAVPTTAGTGSEATRYAVFSVDGEKRPIGHPALTPDHVILDPELTYSLPPAVTASTGLDALAQAMESMWSTRSTDASYVDARAALRLALDHLETAVNRPDPIARAAMCTAAHLSGRAIDVSATTASHALSFHLTTEYGVPHGHAVALTLGPVLEYNAAVRAEDCTDPRGPSHLRTVIADVLSLMGAATPSEARRRLTDLVESVYLEPTLRGVGVETAEQRRRLAASASPIRLATNPRRFDAASLGNVINDIP